MMKPLWACMKRIKRGKTQKLCSGGQRRRSRLVLGKKNPLLIMGLTVGGQ